MRVKVGDIWYDANDLPIKIELTKGEREQITRIRSPTENGHYGYGVLPMKKLGWTEEQAHDWMYDKRMAFTNNAKRHEGKEALGEIEIFVVGDHIQSGKTLVAALVLRALLQEGFSNVKFTCQDGDIQTYLPKIDQKPQPLTSDRISTVPTIVVHDNNQRPEDMPRPLHLTDIGIDGARFEADDTVEMTIEFPGINLPKSK